MEEEVNIGRTPVYVILLVTMLLIGLWSYQEHNYARRDREAAMQQRDRIAIIEDRIRDVILNDETRPLIIYYIDGESWSNKTLLEWQKLELQKE